MRIFNKHILTPIRKELRNTSPKAERILWSYIKNKQLGYKFRRQYSVERYIIDFYCSELKLAIKVDGDTHYMNQEVMEYDKERQLYIESFGIRFLRFTNDDVYTNIEGVIEAIQNYLCTTPSCPPPCEGGGTRSSM